MSSLAHRLNALLSKTTANGATMPESMSALAKAQEFIRAKSASWAADFRPTIDLSAIPDAPARPCVASLYSTLIDSNMRRIAIAAKMESNGLFSRDPTTLNGELFDSCDPKHGPVYPKLPGLDKFRRIANGGAETEEEERAYGAAVGKAFRSLNAISASKPISTACTAETDAKCRARILAAFEAGIRADRARRTDAQIIAEYHAIMADKRKREARALAPEVPAPVMTPEPTIAATRARRPRQAIIPAAAKPIRSRRAAPVAKRSVRK